MPHKLTFRYSSHARKMMARRRVSQAQTEDAVVNRQKRHQQYKGTHGGIVWKYEKQQPSGKMLAVVAELYKGICYVVTTFYE